MTSDSDDRHTLDREELAAMGRAELRRRVRRELGFDPERESALRVDELRRILWLVD